MVEEETESMLLVDVGLVAVVVKEVELVRRRAEEFREEETEMGE